MKKTLIAYFTRTGITKKLAEDTAKQTGADLFAIEPVKEYSSSYLICPGQAGKSAERPPGNEGKAAEPAGL